MSHIALQVAKMSGFNPIITTASPANIAYCKAAGATHVIDYHTVPYSSLGAHIASTITTKPIRIISDIASSEDSQKACWGILSDSGKMSITLPLAKSLEGELAENLVDAKDGSKKGIYSVFGNGNAPGIQEDGDRLAPVLEEWLKEGKIKVRCWRLPLSFETFCRPWDILFDNQKLTCLSSLLTANQCRAPAWWPRSR